MKVDMSPEAISGRLEAMGQLWELSVALMGAEPANGRSPAKSRGIEIQDSIRRVFLRDWDPIGICGVSSAVDEYDAYISPVYRILVGTRSAEDLVECLARIEREELGITSDESQLRGVAAKLLDLEVRLNY
jgi:hypothetical protein